MSILIIILIVLAFGWAEQKRAKEQPVPTGPYNDRLRIWLESITGFSPSKEKLDALSVPNKNVLVTARAGAGKTAVIALRAALELDKGTKATDILALSFNRNAALGLGRRMDRYGAKLIPSSTFHALAHSIVQPARGTLVFGQARERIVEDCLRPYGFKEDGLRDSILALISKCKHLNLTPEQANERAKGKGNLATLAVDVFERYQQALADSGRIDFDDLIEAALTGVDSIKDGQIIRLGSQSVRFGSIKLLCIDEFQDFSSPFFRLVQKLRDRNSSMGLYCVGDDWQAINGFAGSNLDYFRNFEGRFGDSARVSLLTNYRSGREIVEYANKQMRGMGAGGLTNESGGEVEFIKGGLGGVCVRQFLASLGRPCLVLSRSNSLYGVDLASWEKEYPFANFMTVHRAKGMEADTVLYAKQPYRKDVLSRLNVSLGLDAPDDKLEERRISYVAHTRARSRLIVVQ